jgi:hypothetical protein
MCIRLTLIRHLNQTFPAPSTPADLTHLSVRDFDLLCLSQLVPTLALFPHLSHLTIGCMSDYEQLKSQAATLWSILLGNPGHANHAYAGFVAFMQGDLARFDDPEADVGYTGCDMTCKVLCGSGRQLLAHAGQVSFSAWLFSKHTSIECIEWENDQVVRSLSWPRSARRLTATTAHADRRRLGRVVGASAGGRSVRAAPRAKKGLRPVAWGGDEEAGGGVGGPEGSGVAGMTTRLSSLVGALY